MKLLLSGLACVAAAACIAACGSSDDSPPPAQAADNSVSVPLDEVKFFETGVGPLQAADVFGELTKGAHGSFVKLPAGFVSPLHTHSDDYYGIVVSGVISNQAEGAAEPVELAPGSYWFQRGKAKHVTSCLAANECVIYLTQTAPFDFVPAP